MMNLSIQDQMGLLGTVFSAIGYVAFIRAFVSQSRIEDARLIRDLKTRRERRAAWRGTHGAAN